MTTREGEPTWFGQLVANVDVLKSRMGRVRAAKTSSSWVVVKPRARGSPLDVEIVGGVVIGRAPDVPVRFALDLRYGPELPARELELHRMSAVRAASALHRAVEQAVAGGIRCLIVVCGRGTHSGHGGPVLRCLVIDELAGPLARHVLAFRSAPARFGGQGAFIVRLRLASTYAARSAGSPHRSTEKGPPFG